MRTLEERFWSKVNRDGPVPAHRPELGPCWLWTGAIRMGYGAIKRDGKAVSAHRVSYEIAHGAIPEGEGFHGTCICHACDVRLCVRPDHLFLGSCEDNVHDMWEKGRAPVPRGEKLSSKFTEEDVRLIRSAAGEGFLHSDLAKVYSVHRSAIDKIVSRERWGHVA